MEYKIQTIPVSEENPFEHDALERKPAVEALSSLILGLKPPFVLALDSPWGTGKTTFVRMWMAHLRSMNLCCLYSECLGNRFCRRSTH